jgi:hypothetical protein
MTPKQKANELFFKYYEIIKRTLSLDHVIISKKCAIIAVDEILSLSKISSLRRDDVYMELEYWIEVKQEIEKL